MRSPGVALGIVPEAGVARRDAAFGDDGGRLGDDEAPPPDANWARSVMPLLRPSTALYWHIGATQRRLRSGEAADVSGENRLTLYRYAPAADGEAAVRLVASWSSSPW